MDILANNEHSIIKDNLSIHRERLNEVRGFYLLYETEQSKAILNAVQVPLNRLRIQGRADFLFGGSVGFGQATTDTEDLDFTYVGDNPPAFRRVVGAMLNQLKGQNVELSSLDYEDIDIRLVDAYVEYHQKGTPYPQWLLDYCKEDFVEDQYSRFMKLFWVTRQNEPELDKLFSRGLSLTDRLTSDIKSNIHLGNSIPGVSGEDWKRSFVKYHERLKSRNVPIPERILGLERLLVE